MGEPGPGEMTILSNAFFSYKQSYMYSHVHSSLYITTGATMDQKSIYNLFNCPYRRKMKKEKIERREGEREELSDRD